MEKQLCSYVECVIKNFFASRRDIFGEKSEFLRFETNTEYRWTEGYNSSAVFGRIVYTTSRTSTAAANSENKVDVDVQSSEPFAIKTMPNINNLQYLQVFAFSNEIFFYTKLLPLYATLNESATSLFGKFYYGNLTAAGVDSENAAIIFENLKAKRYATTKRKSFLDISHLRLMMKKIGEFHAYSYEAKRTSSGKFFSVTNAFVEIGIPRTDEFSGFLQEVGKRGVQPLLNDPAYRSKTGKINELMRTASEFFERLFTEEKANFISVLCHGDYLRSNVMFSYDDIKAETPVDLKIIDLASCRLASPVVDLSLVLYVNADQDTRDRHWDELIDEYYNALKRTFPQNDEIPAKESIVSEFRIKSFYAYIVASYFLGQLIAEDYNLETWNDLMPAEFKNKPYCEVPPDIGTKVSSRIGGSFATESFSNILKDMIDRGFV